MTVAYELPWIWLFQIMLLILFVGLVLAALIILIQRRRPVQVHVLVHRQAQSWEDVKAQIQDQEGATEWRYTEVARERLGLLP